MHWLKQWRLQRGMSREDLAKKVRNHNTGCSDTLIAIVEGGGVTHPGIANRIATVTGATAQQRDSMVHKMHRGKWTPRKTGNYSDSGSAKQQRPMTPGCAAVNARKVVQIDMSGFEIGRYDSMFEAAMNARCSTTTVQNRCERKLKEGTNEFQFFGCTFRYSDDWDKMDIEQRRADMHFGVRKKRK